MAKKETGAPSVLSSFADLANIPSLINNTNSPVDDAQADETFNQDYLDAQDLIAEPGSIVGVAGKPMTEISIDGREVIHQPMTIESMLSTHAPYRFKVDPTRISFDSAGTLPALNNASAFVFRPTGIQDIPNNEFGSWGGYPWGTGWPLGIVLRVVINDTQVGEGSIGIETLPGLKAEWSVTNGAGESMLCILSHQEDYVVTSRTQVSAPESEQIKKELEEPPREKLPFTPNAPIPLPNGASGIEESVVGGAADNYYFTPNNSLDYIITGANVIVHIYPLYLTREIQAITAAALTADRLPDLAGFFAEGYLSQE